MEATVNMTGIVEYEDMEHKNIQKSNIVKRTFRLMAAYFITYIEPCVMIN